MAKKFLTLREYINSQGKVEKKPFEKVVADEVDVPDNRKVQPPKADYGLKDGKVAQVKENHLDVFPITRRLIGSNPWLMEQFVRDLKRHNVLPSLVAEMLQHPETFKQIANVMASESYGQDISRKLVKALMSEEVSPPMFGDEEDEEMPMDDEEEDEFSDEEMPEDEEMMDDEEDMGDEDEMPEDEAMMGGDEEEMPQDEESPMSHRHPMGMGRHPNAMENFVSAMKDFGIFNEGKK